MGKISSRNEGIVKYYNAAGVLVIPSQYEEGFARVVLESLSCGTPVIAANKGCLPEMINSSVGVLIKPTVNNLFEKIQYFYKNPEELKKIKHNCRRYAEKKFGERNAQVIENAYQE